MEWCRGVFMATLKVEKLKEKKVFIRESMFCYII